MLAVRTFTGFNRRHTFYTLSCENYTHMLFLGTLLFVKNHPNNTPLISNQTMARISGRLFPVILELIIQAEITN